MNLSEPARTALEWLSTEYAKAGCPNHREWAFAPNQKEWGAFAELSAQGYIEPHQLRGHQQIWRLTEDGRVAVLRLAEAPRSRVSEADPSASSSRTGSVFDEYAARLTKEQRSILGHAVGFQLKSDALIEGKHVRLLFPPEEADRVHAILQSLVPEYLEASPRKRPYDTYVLTPVGLLLSPAGGRASKLIEDVLLLFRSRLAQNPTFNKFTWDNLKRSGLATGDNEFSLVHVTIKTMRLNGDGSSTPGPPPSFSYALPPDIEELRRYEFFYQLLDLRQRQYESRVGEEIVGRPDAPPLNSFGTVPLSGEARQLLSWLREQYIKAGYPNHKVWTFKAYTEHRAVFAELRAHGYIETLGLGNVEWRLTDLSQRVFLVPQPARVDISRSESALSHDEILALRAAVISARLAGSRGALLAHISAEFVATLPVAPAPGEQVLMDLDALNAAGTLSDGSVPLGAWLTNAVALSGGRQEAKVFEDALDRCQGARPSAPAAPSGTATSAFVHHHGDIIMGSKFTTNISGDTKIGAFGQGDNITVSGSLTVNMGAAGSVTQEQHKAAIQQAQNALNEDQDRLAEIDERLYEALGQFLRLARQIQVEQQSFAEVQAKMKETLDDMWAQQAAKGLRPQALPQGLKVVEALAKSPVTAEVAKKLLGAG